MSETSLPSHFTGLARLKLYFALSRTPHGLLDMCTPAFGALLWLGHFPSAYTILIGIITTFAGYTAVYALNDVIDYKADREKAEMGGFSNTGNDLDSIIVRHPMAQGLLSFKEGLCWALSWALLALLGAYILNPVCVLIFLCGCALETFYCILWRISPFRTIVSGAVKTTGALAAVYAVDPHPSGIFVVCLFFMLFFWEIGGQNIPNDGFDVDEDRRFHARTIPVVYGIKTANVIIVAAVILTLIMGIVLFSLSLTIDIIGFVLICISVAVGVYLLLLPALKYYQSCEPTDAMALFNKASYYPMALLAVVLIKMIFSL
ncbi:MAG: UbiA family prenyltransferase [Desulfobacterales bacterium]